MLNKIYLSLLLFILSSCNFNPRCIEANDFGDPKVSFDTAGKNVDVRYPGDSDATWIYSSESVATGYVLSGGQIVAKIEGGWSPWSETTLDASTTYDNVESSQRVCDYATDFEPCTSGSAEALDADSCFQPIYDGQSNPKVCWYVEGLGLYVTFSINPDDGLELFYHVADYFQTSVSGYPNDWYFVIDPTTLTYNGEDLLTAFGVDSYSEIKVSTYIHMYDDYSMNSVGCLNDENSLDSTNVVDKLNVEDGDMGVCSASVTLSFYSGVKLGEPIYTQAAADTIFDKYLSIVHTVFDTFVSSSYLGRLINLALTAFVAYIGIAFFLGLTRFTMQESLGHVLRLGLFLTVINSGSGWDFYNEYFVEFVWNGSQELANEVMTAVNMAVVEELDNVDNFYFIGEIETSIFGVIDDIISVFLSKETHTKIWAIGIAHYYGIFIIIAIYITLLYFVLAVTKFAIALIMVFFTMIMLLAIGPIVFVFLLFNFTREYFMRWLQNVFSVFLQPVFFVIFFGPFATIATFYLYKILYFQVCWKNICCENWIGVDVIGYWSVNTSYEYDPATGLFEAIGRYQPDYYDMLILFILAALLRLLTDEIPGIATKLSGGLSLATTDLAKAPMAMLDSGVISGRNAALGGAFMVSKGAINYAAICIADYGLQNIGLKSLASVVPGSKANNLAKAKKNMKNTMRDRGYTDAEIAERMKSEHEIQDDMKKEGFTEDQIKDAQKSDDEFMAFLNSMGYSDEEMQERLKGRNEVKARLEFNKKDREELQTEYLRLKAKTRETRSPFGMVASIASDFTTENGQGILGTNFAPGQGVQGLYKRAMASYHLSKSKDFRNKKMSKAAKDKLADEMTGTGRYRKQYTGNEARKERARQRIIDEQNRAYDSRKKNKKR